MPLALPRQMLLALLGPALACLFAAADAAPALNGLNQMRRDICRSFKLDCRKRDASPATRKPPSTARTAKPRQGQAKVQEPDAHPAAPVPKPRPPVAPSAPTVAALPAAPVPRAKPAAVPLPTPSIAESRSAVPMPRARPALLPALPPVARVVSPAPTPNQLETMTASIAPPARSSAGPSTCAQGLRSGKVQFDAVPAPFGDAACPVVDPVRLHAVETPSGVVRFPEGPVFSCRFARQFALWVSDTGSAVVLAQTSKRLETVATGPGYDCRRRNGDSSAKMSEHAAGDAVDVTSLTIAGGTAIRMADAIDPASPSYPVLRALRTTACGYFTTVLGAGSNAAHREHYHFDLGVHGKSGNYRICE